MEKLKFLLDIYEYWTAQVLDADDEVSGFYSFPVYDFKIAIEEGRVELLSEIIRRTGAGLPLESMVKNTGVELQVKPRWYQGLTVYGKKRCVSGHAQRPVLVLVRRDVNLQIRHTERTGPKLVDAASEARAAPRPRPSSSPRLPAGSRLWSGSSVTLHVDSTLPLPTPKEPGMTQG